MKSYKNRKIQYEKPVLVYRCLNRKGKVYSIKQNGYVVAHTTSLKLLGCDFIVNESGKERVRKEKQKNVHAFIRGHIVRGQVISNRANCNDYLTVKYNPYKNDSFMVTNFDNETPIKVAKYVLIECGIVKVYVPKTSCNNL
jgi:hypothetical protein